MRFTLPGKSPTTELIWAMPMFMVAPRKHPRPPRAKGKTDLRREDLLKNFTNDGLRSAI
jgi:hypothetical protein